MRTTYFQMLMNLFKVAVIHWVSVFVIPYNKAQKMLKMKNIISSLPFFSFLFLPHKKNIFSACNSLFKFSLCLKVQIWMFVSRNMDTATLYLKNIALYSMMRYALITYMFKKYQAG